MRHLDVRRAGRRRRSAPRPPHPSRARRGSRRTRRWRRCSRRAGCASCCGSRRRAARTAPRGSRRRSATGRSGRAARPPWRRRPAPRLRCSRWRWSWRAAPGCASGACRACRAAQGLMPISFCAVPPRMAMRCSSLRPGRRQHEVDLGAGPRERIVGADHDLADAGLGDQVAQRLGREHDGVEEQLAVLADRPSASSSAAARRGWGRCGSPRPSGWRRSRRKPPPCAAQILRPGKRSSVPSKIRCDSAIVVSSGLPIVLVEQAAAAEPAARLQLARAGRMQEDQDAVLLALRPERIELRIGQLEAGDAAADADAAEAELLHRMLDLLGRQFGMLQRRRGEGHEAVGLLGAELDQRLVLQPDQLGRLVLAGAVPVGIDAEALDVDALRCPSPRCACWCPPSAGPAPRADA